jgi:hypothetical protein
MGRPRRARTHARQEAPIPRPPGGHGGRHHKRGRTLRGQAAGARTHAPAARRLAMSRASRRSLKSSSPSPTSPPPRGDISSGVCLRQLGLLGRSTPVPSLLLGGLGVGVLMGGSYITCDHYFQDPAGRRLIKPLGPLVESFREGLYKVWGGYRMACAVSFGRSRRISSTIVIMP